MAKTRTRNSKGRFVKSGRKTSTALARRSSSSVVVVRAPSAVATRRKSRAPARRGGRSRGGVAGALDYIGGGRLDDIIAAGALGLAVRQRRSTVETIINYAPNAVRGVGAYGVIALMAGIAHHMGYGRKYTGPIARAASIIAANKLTTRGGFYADSDLSASLSGDDDVGEDVIDVGAFDDEIGDGNDVTAGDDGDLGDED